MPTDSVSRSVAVLGRATLPEPCRHLVYRRLLSPATNSTSNRCSVVSAPTGIGTPPRSMRDDLQLAGEVLVAGTP